MTERARARAVVAMAALSLVVSALAGVVWGLIAPGQHLYVEDSQHVLGMDLDSNNVFVAIALFVFITALAGVLCGALAWAWRSTRGPEMALAVTVAGLGGAWLASGIGGLVASARLDWPGDGALAGMVEQVVTRPPSIDLWVALIGQALAAGLVYLVAAMLHPDSELAAGSDGRAQDGELVGDAQA